MGMKPTSITPRPRSAIWQHAVGFEKELSSAAARALLQVRFAPGENERMSELLDQARSRKLTPEEEEQLNTYEMLGSLLGILHSKARQALKKHAANS
jgi:hypothetical protein